MVNGFFFENFGDVKYLFLSILPSRFQHDSSYFPFQVCDEPHPMLIKDMLSHCAKGDIDEAYKVSCLRT